MAIGIISTQRNGMWRPAFRKRKKIINSGIRDPDGKDLGTELNVLMGYIMYQRTGGPCHSPLYATLFFFAAV